MQRPIDGSGQCRHRLLDARRAMIYFDSCFSCSPRSSRHKRAPHRCAAGRRLPASRRRAASSIRRRSRVSGDLQRRSPPRGCCAALRIESGDAVAERETMEQRGGACAPSRGYRTIPFSTPARAGDFKIRATARTRTSKDPRLCGSTKAHAGQQGQSGNHDGQENRASR